MTHALVSTATVPRELRPLSRRGAALRLGGVTVGLGVAVATLVALLPSSWFAGAMIVLYGGLFAEGMRRRRLVYALVRENDDAVAMINAGRARAAALTLEALAQRAGAIPWLHSLIVYNRAIASLRMGEYLVAQALLDGVRTSRWLNSPRLPYRELLAVAYGQVAWGLGDLAQARAWIDTASQTLSAARRGILVPLHVMVLGAEGRWADALQVARVGRPDLEAVATAGQMRMLRALEAFVLSHRDGSPQTRAEVEHLVAGCFPLQSWDLVSLRAAWPEFNEFCRQWGLDAPPEGYGGP